MPRVIRMPSAESIDKAYREAIPRVPAKYLERVKMVPNFKERAIEGEEAFKAAMEKVIAEERRKKGLELMAPDAWLKGVEKKGAKRIGDGMKIGAPKRKARYEPYRAALDGLELPDKTPDWEANIDNILKKVVKTLVEKKKELMGIS